MEIIWNVCKKSIFKKWRLNIGIHAGTLMSRDVDEPQYFIFKFRAIKKFKSDRKGYKEIGYKIWYAYLNNLWTGKETCLEKNSYER